MNKAGNNGALPAIANRQAACCLIVLAIALLLAVPPAAGEPPQLPPLYRVEVIVFVHEHGRPDAFLEEELRSFDGLLDPLELAEAERRAIEASEEFERLYPGTSSPESRRETQALPKPLLAVDERSDAMARALRRLEDSAAYRPVARQVGYQPAERGTRTPGIRLHDREVIRQAQPEQEVSDGPIRIAGDTWDRFTDEPEAQPPRPEVFYRLDGSLRLRQRQFLHLDLDLEWREPARRIASGTVSSEAGFERRAWSVHRLQDSRVVRAGRLEYFDSPWLGVLVHLERFEQPVVEPEPRLDPAAIPDTDIQGESPDE